MLDLDVRKQASCITPWPEIQVPKGEEVIGLFGCATNQEQDGVKKIKAIGFKFQQQVNWDQKEQEWNNEQSRNN